MTCPAAVTLAGRTYRCNRDDDFHSTHRAIDYAGVVGVMSTAVKIEWRQVEVSGRQL
jgi:hypothetical protein